MSGPSPSAEPVERLLERKPFAWLRERDVDLLLCSELHGNRVLSAWIGKRIGAPVAFAGAWVSLGEMEGESDLVVAWGEAGAHHLLLVENKIDALFQPDQAARYRLRAERWRKEEGIASVRTAMLAPSGYLNSGEAVHFDHLLSYEELAEFAAGQGDGRTHFLAEALLAGVDKYRRGYVAEPNAQISQMWEAIWRLAVQVAPRLRMPRPDWKPGQSFWIYFRQAEGVERIGWRTAVVVLKAERGHVDLQIGSTPASELARRARGLLDPDMQIVSAGKSSSIRTEVEPIDFLAAPELQSGSIVAALEQCERLRTLLARHSDRLLGEGQSMRC